MLRLIVVSLVLGFALTACAAPERAPTRAEATDGVVTIVGNDHLQFVPNEVTSDSGRLEIALTCEGSAPHTLVITETDELVAECTRGTTGRGDVELAPGTYRFFCSVPGHRRQGMVGTLTVSG